MVLQIPHLPSSLPDSGQPFPTLTVIPTNFTEASGYQSVAQEPLKAVLPRSHKHELGNETA